MKPAIYLSFLIFSIGCQKTDCISEARKEIALTDQHRMTVPSCFELESSYGIEAAAGSIIDLEGQEILKFSIGPWADYTVDIASPMVALDTLGNSPFIYQFRGDLYDETSCCWHITFHTKGIPSQTAVTFRAFNDDRWSQAIGLLRTLR